MAAAMANGGDGAFGWCEGERQRRGGGPAREGRGAEGRGGVRGVVGASRGRRRQPGREELASSAARVRARSCSYWQEEDDRRESGGGLGQMAGPPAGPTR